MKSQSQTLALTQERAVGLTLTNHASRATRAIYQDVLPEVTQDVEEQLTRLHPPATSTAIPALPPNAPFVPVLGDDNFVRLWKKRVANGAAPAVSGFTGDHGLPLLEDSHCLRGLALLIQLIRNGLLSDQCRTYLLLNVQVAYVLSLLERRFTRWRPLLLCTT